MYLHAKGISPSKQMVQPIDEAGVFDLSDQQGGKLWLGHHVLLAFRREGPAVMEEMDTNLGDEVSAEHVGRRKCLDLIRHHERKVGLHFGRSLLKGTQLVGRGDLLPRGSAGFGDRRK